MRIRLNIFLLILTFIFSGSCRKKDNAEPVIVITSPAAGTSYFPGDTVHLEADISDDEALPAVTIKLLNGAYTPSDHQESVEVNASSYHLSFDYVIENQYLETGNYNLTISATDGDNDVNAYKTVAIHEIPRTTKEVYVITKTGNDLAISTLDNTNQLVNQFGVAGDFSGASLNSRHKRLSIAGYITGAYQLIDLTTKTNIFSVPPYGGAAPSFQYVVQAHDLTFVSFYDGRIKGFDKDGVTKFNAEQPVYYSPGVLCVNDNYLFAEAVYQNDTRLVVIFYPSGVAKQEFNIGMDIVSMAGLDDNNVLVFGNKNGNGKIYTYHVSTNNVNDFHTLFGNSILDVESIDSDRYAIATANGLYSYEESTNNLVPVDLNEPVNGLEFNEVTGILYANTGMKIKTYAFPASQVLSTVTTADSVMEVKVLYSK